MGPPEDGDSLSIDRLLDDCWTRLGRAVRDRRHPWRLPVLATIDAAGAPTARTVVLREAGREDAVLACHTDRRSPKVAEIAADPRVAWTFYDPGSKLQVRASGLATVHLAAEDDPIALERWQATSLPSRRCYLAPRTPGAVCDVPSANLPDGLDARNPDLDESEAGRANFAVLRTRIARFDVLTLHASGHERASFEFDRDGAATRSSWLEP